MPIQKVPLESLQKIRQHIKSTLIVPDGENRPRSLFSQNEEEDLPEPDSLNDLGNLFDFGGVAEFDSPHLNTKGKWFISLTNPGVALMKLPGLRLKSGIRLVTYLHRTVEEGRGVTWAIPDELSTTAQLEKALIEIADSRTAPQPAGALADVMDGVEGDRSALSFLIASILRRELGEFGAVGKACDWSHHRLINTIPSQVSWEWRITPPKDLSPKVLIYPDKKAAIEFFSCRVTAPIAIFQHIDQYPAEHYNPASTNRAIAVPQRSAKPG